jgi:hypothetical protein
MDSWNYWTTTSGGSFADDLGKIAVVACVLFAIGAFVYYRFLKPNGKDDT